MEASRKDLLAAIKMVMPAMAAKETFDQANKIAFVAGKVVAFNDAVAIVHPLPGGLELDGAVDGRHLFDLLEKLTAETVDLTVIERRMNLRSGRTKASFDLLPVTLPIDQVDTSSGVAVPLPEGFTDRLGWVSASCAKDMSRPLLCCVSIADGWMQSSDSYRASRVACGDLPGMLIGAAQAEVLVDYPVTTVALSDGGEWARFTTEGGTVLCARSSAGKFPDLGVFYEVEGPEVQLTKALTEVIERARIFSKREHAIDEEVGIVMKPNQIIVSAHYDGGRFEETVRCEGAKPATFTIHPKFLSAALKSGTRCVLGPRSVRFSGNGRDAEGKASGTWDHVVALKVD